MNKLDKVPVTMYYMIYQFNIGEILAAERFCKENGIYFMAHCAYINDPQKMSEYLKSTLDDEYFEKISKNLFLHYIDGLMESYPNDYICPQYSCLSIDEYGNLLPCCGTSKDQKEYSLGSVLDLNLNDICLKKQEAVACKECITLKKHFLAHNPLPFSNLIKPDMHQMILADCTGKQLLTGILDKIKRRIIRFK